MRRLIVALAACFLLLQAGVAAVTPYAECCLQSCKGLPCATAHCQSCTAQAMAVAGSVNSVPVAPSQAVPHATVRTVVSPLGEVWRPPD